MRNWSVVLILVFLLAACGEKTSSPVDSIPRSALRDTIDTVVAMPHHPDTADAISPLERRLRAAGLVDVSTLDSTIRVDLRYSTTDNFNGVDVYGDFNRCYLQPDVAEKLVKAQAFLRAKYPYYSLVVYDAVRPLHIQRLMWDTLRLAPGQKTKYLSNPDNGSLHNYGAAVDAGIVDDHGFTLDMGTPYDFFGEKAHPVKEQELLASGELTYRQVRNRELLREAMRHAGFFGIQTEWWHFNSCRRAEAAEKYEMVE